MTTYNAIIPRHKTVKKLWLLCCIISTISICNAQMFGPQRVITTEADRPRFVVAADLDNDGFSDVVSSSENDNIVAWHKNQGDNTFGPQQVIDVLNQLMFLDVADLNDDGDLDILVSVTFSDELLWFENLGNENFGPKQVISDAVERCQNPIAADFDGDGDLDVAVATDFDDTIRWFENSDWEGTFTTAHTVSNQGNNGRNIAVGDLDGDGDPDIVAESAGSESLSWYKNLDGQGNFGSPTPIDPDNLATNHLTVADFDGDSDLDIVTAKILGGYYYFENLDGQGNYGNRLQIPNSPDAGYSLFAADFDNDGDLDIVSSTADSDNTAIIWFENKGAANFETHTITTNISEFTGAIVSAADLDNDGDLDILYNESFEDKIFWHENFTILGTKDFNADNFTVYPNPSDTCLYIETTLPLYGLQVSIFNAQGKRVYSGNVKTSRCLDIAILPSGLYWATIKTKLGSVQKKFIKK